MFLSRKHNDIQEEGTVGKHVLSVNSQHPFVEESDG